MRFYCKPRLFTKKAHTDSKDKSADKDQGLAKICVDLGGFMVWLLMKLFIGQFQCLSI